VVDVERLDEVRRLVADRSVHPIKSDLLGALLHTSLVEHGFERHAAPARIAHRAIAQLAAGDARIEKSAAIARALIDRDELDRGKLLDFLQRQLERTIDLALDLQREFIRVDVERYIRQMIANEKSIVRRNYAVVENGKRRLELRRPAGQADHRTLLRILHQRPFAVIEGQRDAVERERRGRTEARCQRCHAGALHHFPSVDHCACSEVFLSRPVSIGRRQLAFIPFTKPEFTSGSTSRGGFLGNTR